MLNGYAPSVLMFVKHAAMNVQNTRPNIARNVQRYVSSVRMNVAEWQHKDEAFMGANINNKGTARLFQSPLLEALSKTRPWIIYAIYIPLNIYLVGHASAQYKYSPGQLTMLFFAGLFSWTLAEYLTHRFLFHYHPKSVFAKRLVYIFHENHHEFPRDKMRLFMPPVPSLVIAAIMLTVFSLTSYIASGSIGYALVFFPGFVTGYLMYVSMHYAIHAYAPPSFLKVLWRNHQLHHYKYPDKAFGVSSVLWDKVFRTMPERKSDK